MDEPLLKVLEDEIRRAKRRIVRIRDNGVEIVYKPTFISATHKKIKSYENTNNGTDLEKSGNYCVTRKDGVIITIGVGDTNGDGTNNGEVFLAKAFKLSQLKSDNLSSIEEKIKESLQNVFLKAVVQYRETVSSQIDGKKKNAFSTPSKEECNECLEDLVDPEVDVEKANAILKKIIAELKKIPNIKEPWTEYRAVLENRRYVDTEGNKITESNFAGKYIIGAKGIKTRDGRIIDEYCEIYTFNNPEEMLLEEKIAEVLERVKKRINEIIESKPVEAGVYQCIFDAEAACTLIHEAFASHLLTGEWAESSGRSLKLGQRILNYPLNVCMDPTINGFGSFKFDEEGIKARRIELIKNGKIAGYLHNRITAGRNSTKSSGHMRNESFEPGEPRESNLFIDSQEAITDKELWTKFLENLKQTNQKGIYVAGGDGEVDEDGFFVMTGGLLYEVNQNGDMIPVSSAYIRCDVSDIANNILGIGESKTHTSFCGSESGIVPVQETGPSMLINNVKIFEEKKNITAGAEVEEERDTDVA